MQRHNAMLAALGMASITVHMPAVSIVSFGDELAQPGSALGSGRVFDANSRMLADGAARCGCLASFAGIVRDDVAQISKALKKAARADAVLCSGGTSAGKGDFLADALKRLRAKILFHGIAAKPGKPTLLAMLGAKPVFGLPGYPVSCYMLFDSLVAPYLRKCSRIAQQHQSASARLANAYNNTTGRLVFQPVRLYPPKKNWKHVACEISATTVAKRHISTQLRKTICSSEKLSWTGMERGIAHAIHKDSGAIATLAEADGYFAVPASVKRIEKGDAVKVMLF
jgi:molybdenum cofactor synthesis domain-containing protein